MERQRLPDRRSHQVLAVDHAGFRLTVGVGRFDDGRLGEIFIDTHKGGTAIDTILRDSAILASFALQAGIDAVTIRKALAPRGPIAAVLDKIEGEP
jgi:ribonucleoside-diphosphate reductase alpha chain